MASSPLGMDPWKELQRSFPAKVTSRESAKKIMSQISSLQTSRTGIKALGGTEKSKTKKGFISALFDPEKGVLFAPARGVSAGLADVLGLAQDTELADYNPLESAFRATKGEFAVTGGDIIRTEESDSVLERAAKLGGAFAWDVVTDPLNYVGGAGVFSKKGLLTATLGDDVLRRNIVAKLETTALKTKNAEEVSGILNKLASNTREVVAGEVVVNPAGELLNEAGELLTKEARDGLAARSLAGVIADSFSKGGRGSIVPALTEIVGDEAIATELFKSLDQELVGGLFLKNPITGKPIKRIAGGSGKGNLATDAANQLRFRVSSGFAGRWGSRDLSGRLGPTWAAYKQGLLAENVDRLATGRTLFTDFTDYKVQSNLFKNALSERMGKLHAASSHITRARKKLSEEEQGLFDQQVKYFFHNQTDELAESPAVTKLARAAALEIRQNFEEALDEFKALNIELGYQENFIPLMYSDEYIDHVMQFDPKQGRETRGGYRGSLKRIAYTSPRTAEELEALAPAEQVVKLIGMPPLEANKVANKVYDKAGNIIPVFETDPLKMLERYAEWAARTVETNRFVKGLEAAGVMIHVPAETLRIVNLHNAAAMADALGTVAPEARRALAARLRALKDELNVAVSDDLINQREADRALNLTIAQEQFDEANVRLSEATAYLRELNASLVSYEPSVKKLKKMLLDKNLRSQFRSADNIARTVERFAADVQNAKSRLARAQANAELTEAAKAAVEQKGLRPTTRAGRKEFADARRAAKAQAQKVKKLEDELANELEDLRDVRDSLNSVRTVIDENAEFMATGQLNDMLTYMKVLEEKLAVYQRIKEVYKPARRAAKDELQLLGRDIAMPRADAVRKATFSYMELRRRYNYEVIRQRGLAKGTRTAQDKARLQGFKEAARQAKDDLTSLIADVNPNRTNVQTAGREYVKQLVRMADNLSSEQATAAFAFADSSKLNVFIDALNDPNISHATRMEAYGDMMRSYGRLRRYVDEDQLRILGDYEKVIYDEPKYAFESRGTRFTAKINALRDDLAAAQRRNDLPEVDRLMDEIDKVNSLTEADGLRLIGAGTVKVPANLEDMYAPLGIRQVMERMYQLERNTSEWESFIGRVYDPLALVWKTAATVGRGPAYTFTNIIGGLVNNWLGGVSAKDHALAGKIIWAYDKAIKEALKDEPDLATVIASGKAVDKVRALLGDLQIRDKSAVEVFEDFLKSGTWLTTDVMSQAAQLRKAGLLTNPLVLADQPGIRVEWPETPSGKEIGRGEDAFRSTVNALLTWKAQRIMNDVNQSTEMFLRLSAYISGYQRFGSKYSALENVMLLHFDYQDLSDAELWIKRFVPFYTWTRNNVPLQLRAAFLQQDKVRKLITLNENLKDAFGADGNDSWLAEVMPDYIDINGGFASVAKFAGNNLAFFPKTPINDIDKLFSMGSIFGIPVPVPRLREVAQTLGPAVSPLEFITNTNFDTGQQFRSGGEKAEQMTRSLVPYLGTVQRIASALTVPATLAGADLSGVPLIQAERGMSNLFNFLIGAPYGATTITERTLYGGLIQRSIASAAQLKELAAEAGVDSDWLRKEIRKGTNLADLRLKIAKGEGNIKRRALQKKIDIASGKVEDEKPNKDYAQILSAFRANNYGGF